MACSLVEHKRITTTVAKAKALRKFVEPLITKSKTDSTHSRRVVFSNLKSKYAVNELFREVAPKVANREGGYTRIIKTGTRLGDAAEMCMIELVDFNELMLKESKSKTRRSRRGGKKSSGASTEAKADTPKTADATAPAKADEAKAEEVKADDSAAKTEKPAEAKTEKPAEAKAEKPAEEPKAEKPAEAKPEAKKEEPKAKPEEKADEKKAEAKPEAKKEEPEAKKDEPEAKKDEDKKEDAKDSDDKK
ncbi:MAG: 50S ribosomal protein L17 [Cryomorphaceae bacterium]